MDLTAFVRDIADFPKPGIVFKDITPLLADPAALAHCITAMAAPFRDLGIDRVVGIESRGFLFGPGIALALGAGFVPMRKPGKLPFTTRKRSYDLEYGSDTLEIHVDGIEQRHRVLVVDDLLATGGTMAAAIALVGESGAEVIAATVVVELAFLGGAARLACGTRSLIRYE